MFYLNPFSNLAVEREFNRMDHEMNRLFNRMEPLASTRYPAVNVWTRDDVAMVSAELPGYAIDDLSISVQNKTLTISGKRQPLQREGVTVHRHERKPDSFRRTVQIPFAIDSDKVSASYEKGILTVSLPRTEADKPRKIEIRG